VHITLVAKAMVVPALLMREWNSNINVKFYITHTKHTITINLLKTAGYVMHQQV